MEVVVAGDVALVSLSGLVDEHFAGFGNLGEPKAVVINVGGMVRMTSFGVRQWLKAKDALPRTVAEVYLLGCPTFFVDQLNMVLNFGGNAHVLTVIAPYTCLSCGTESGEIVDVLANRALLAKGGVPEKECQRCGGKLELDETPESYFSFVPKYAATSIYPAAAQLLAVRGLYAAPEASSEKPPRIIKLVQGSVTYFRIIGTIGSMFRARPFLVGAEGEVVIDLEEVENFDAAGLPEWRRLLKSLVSQVPTVTLVDITERIVTLAADTFSQSRNIVVSSVLVPYRCYECGRTSNESYVLAGAPYPLQFAARVCSTCGGTMNAEISPNGLAPLQRVATMPPPASAKLIAQREEVVSRALTDANVAQAGAGATAKLDADDTILGKYKIVRRLSEGGMAEVFLAKQIGIGGFEKPVALKRIQSKLLETRHLAIDMFLNEAKIAGRLMHPNIVQVLDVGESAGSLYLAMEYVHGRDLRDVVRKLRSNRLTMPLKDACYIVREVAQALHHAYWSTDLTGNRLSVVHRDVSPHNVIIGFDGTVKLLDFGVAMSSVTDSEQMIVGKWQYMSPEHTLHSPIDHRSDLFSLGVVLYLLCSGAMPFSGKDSKEIVKAVRAGEFTPLHGVPGIVPALADLVSRMLAANPNDRPQTGHEVSLALDDIMRVNGMEASGSDMIALLGGLFVEERPEAMPTIEVVRAPVSSPSPMPQPWNTAETRRAALDASVSLRPRESRHSLTPSTPFTPPKVQGSPVWMRPLLIAVALGLLALMIYVIGYA